MRLALDAMGGDHAPAAAVEGAVLFARELVQHQVVLVGDEARVRPLLKGAPLPNLELRHASEVVGMEDAATSIRAKRDSSLRVCFELMKAGDVQAVVSAGHSGAVMAGALLVLGRLRGVERPAIAALLPALKGGGRCLLLDAGANVECRPSQLAQFAVMGEAYVRAMLGVGRPRVALLSNGEEPSKGTSLTREAYRLLTKSDLRFVGYVEGKDIFSGDVECVVTDGFTGNVVLKTSEGTATAVAGLLRSAIEKAGGARSWGRCCWGPPWRASRRWWTTPNTAARRSSVWRAWASWPTAVPLRRPSRTRCGPRCRRPRRGFIRSCATRWVAPPPGCRPVLSREKARHPVRMSIRERIASAGGRLPRSAVFREESTC